MRKIIVGLIFLALGIVYGFLPGVVLRFNNFVREFIFNDRLAILRRRKIAIVFYFLGTLAILSGILSIMEIRSGSMNPKDRQLYLSYQDYYRRDYAASLEHCRQIIAQDPKNELALEHLARIYQSRGEKKLSQQACKQVLQINPGNRRARKILESLKSNGHNKD